MADTLSPMDRKDGNSRLDGPPPLPSEAKRKAPSSWMDQKGGDPNDIGLGRDAGSPMIQIMGLSAQMQGIIQKASALNPEQADVWATILNASNQAFGQALATTAPSAQGVAPPPGGPPSGPPGMAPPQGMPMPPMGGGPPPGQPGM
jgi:hypothetical protein